MPVEKCCRLFLEERTGNDLRPSSVRGYKSFFKLYLLPECGEMPLAGVDRHALQQVIRRMIRRGLVPNTIHSKYGLMKGIFSWAVRAGFLPATPVKDLSLPERPHKSTAGCMLSVPEVVELLDSFEGTPYWLPVFLGLYTGMRPGELLGLSWDDVDLTQGTLSVRHTLNYRGGGVHLGPPKNRSSERSVAVSAEVVEVLRDREQRKPRDFWFGARAKVGERLEYLAVPVEFRQVCALPDGQVLSGRAWGRGFRSTLLRAGLRRIRLHDLRHTHASLLLLDGVPMPVVSERLGHSNIGTTVNLYGHLLPSSDPAAAARFADIIGDSHIVRACGQNVGRSRFIRL